MTGHLNGFSIVTDGVAEVPRTPAREKPEENGEPECTCRNPVSGIVPVFLRPDHGWTSFPVFLQKEHILFRQHTRSLNFVPDNARRIHDLYG